MTGVRYDSESTPHFSYTYGAHGEVAQVKDNVRGVTVTSEYDVANRPMRKTTMQGGTHVYTGEVTYDQYNNLSSFKEQVGSGRTAYSTTFTHDNENRPTALNFGGSRSMSYTYDSLGRMSQKTVNAGSTGVTTTYTYLGGGHGTGSTTPLVQKMTQQGKTLTYAYDNAGNMTSVNDGSKTVSYGYDLLGQLIRANDPYDTTAGSTGTTWVYSYDLGGNMTSKKAYAYTTGNVGTAVQTISYTYGDSNWKDKLTAYNGAAISYDAIGNPTSDGTWTYTWAKGRQLQSMNKSGTSVSYTYNEDGLRVQKNVSGTVTSYILHGKNVVQLTQGSNNLHFFYGADGSPAMVVYNGASYGYVKNLQGDVVSIVNSSGTEVVHYSYDAWGKLLSKTGTLATSLGTLNPFRYRGYVYDEETGLYYLQTRYFNPTTCRFVNSDVFFGKRFSAYAHNFYTYCHNRPVVQSDSNGTSSCFCTIAFAVAFNDGGYSTKVDITKRLNQVMEDGYKEIQDYLTSHTFPETVLHFVENVQTNGKWDLKNRDDWNLKPDVTYVYNGIPLRWDEPGNISFGYIGSAIFDANTLMSGAGLYQVYSGTSSWEYISSYFDDPLDSMCIEYGYYLKNKVRTIYPGIYGTLEEFEGKFKEVH